MFNARPFAIKFARHEPRILAEMQLFSAVPLPGNTQIRSLTQHNVTRAPRSRDRLTTGGLESEVLHVLSPNSQPDLKLVIRDKVPRARMSQRIFQTASCFSLPNCCLFKPTVHAS